MILFFSDTHMGYKGYSVQNEEGLFSSEIDCLNALETIYEKSKSPEITILIHGGDFFSNSHPTTKNIKLIINWLNKIEELGKPCYFIIGNHCITSFSHSLIFLKELNYKNIHLIDSYNRDFFVQFGKYKIKFCPYIMSESSKDKDAVTHSNFTECMQTAEDFDIIISHVQESSCRVGSEAILISKGVDIVDGTSEKNIILLLGHIHSGSTYMKKNTKVCYSGSPYNQDVVDCGIDKGYVIVDTEGNITFEPIYNTRKFIKHELGKEIDILDYFQNRRLPAGSVNFVEYCNDFDVTKLTELLKSKGCSIGWMHKVKEDKILDNIELETNNVDNYTLFRNFINKKYELNPDWKYINDVINEGIKFIDNFVGKQDE